MVVEQSNNPFGDAGPLDTVMIDDLSHAEMRIVILRELLRTIGMQGAYREVLEGKPRVSSVATLAILRLALTLISRPDPDTVFFASQHLNTLEEGFNPQQKRGAFTNSIIGYASISRTLQYAAGSVTADAYSPTTDADEYLRLAIDDLANLIPVNRLRSYLRYAHENLIIEVPPVDRFWDTPLWADEFSVPNEPEHWNLINQPKKLALLDFFSEQPEIWRFWENWYSGYLNGSPMDSRLLEAVAKIQDDVWEQGAEAVAAAIREIEARRASALPHPENVPELERSTLLKYVEKLLANPDMTALAADGAAQTLRQAISTYLRDAPANALPDELAHLEGLPALFDGIATLAKSDGKSEAKARQMADQIEALNAKVARLEAQLKEARTKTVNGLFTQNMLRAAGTAFGAGAVATLGLSVRHFFGEWPDEFTLENLRGFLIDLQTATPIDGNTASLPPATDV